MKSTQKILLHGSKAPAIVIFGALIIEYAACFMKYGISLEYGLLLLGYMVLCAMITCNNHGKKVRIRFEQELSYIMKDILSNTVFSIFGIAAFINEGISLSDFCRRILYLTLIQLLTILLLCLICGKVKIKTDRTKRIYLYQQAEPDIRDCQYSEAVQVVPLIPDTEAFKEKLYNIKEKISEAEEVYLFEMDAQLRNDWLKICFENNKPVFFTSKLMDMEIRGASLAQDGEAPIFYKSAYGMSKKSAVVKRMLDVVLSGVALIILSPVFLAVAIAIKCEDGDDVFYRQTRCTKDMKEFQIIKFRSMVMGAEETWGPVLAENGDNRMTKVGCFIRKWKLDELPQLINIFMGDMSFVGPRPERPEIMADIVRAVPEFVYRTTVPAGLTGYAQVHSEYHTDFRDKLKWDLMYIENYSLMLDFKIILMTVPAIIRGGF